MTKRIVLSTLVMSLALFIPYGAKAEEATPPQDAPYQETVEPSATDQDPVPIESEPEVVPAEASPVLPTVYTSPMTPIQPEQSEMAAEVPVLHTTTSVVRRHLLVNLVSTLSIQSMRQSPIWSGL